MSVHTNTEWPRLKRGNWFGLSRVAAVEALAAEQWASGLEMKAREIREGDSMLLGQRFVGTVVDVAPAPSGVAVKYRGETTREYRTITIPADQDVHPIDGYDGRFFMRPNPVSQYDEDTEEHFDCGRTDCDGGCHERTVEQFDRGQM